MAAFRRGLGEQGYVEGRNVEILYRYSEGRDDHLPVLAADLIGRNAAVIFAVATPAALAAKTATATIPIVFGGLGSDPVRDGLVASINRPGGNITGAASFATTFLGSRLELMHRLLPRAASIGFLLNPTAPSRAAQMEQAEAAARNLGVRLIILNAGTPSEIDAAFESIAAQGISALVVGNSAFFVARGQQLVALAARHAVPAIYEDRVTVEVGGLMSYGGNFAEQSRIAGAYVGRILKGEKPSDLPVQQPSRFEIVLNLQAAKALGIDVPPSILVLATDVIE